MPLNRCLGPLPATGTPQPSFSGSTSPRPRIRGISLEDTDNDPQWFAFHLVGSLDRTLEGAAEPALRALHGGSGLRTTVPPLVVELLAERVDGRLAIVLDDYHAIHEQACHGFVRGLVDSAPPTVRVVIASRSPPPLRLARMRYRQRGRSRA